MFMRMFDPSIVQSNRMEPNPTEVLKQPELLIQIYKMQYVL